MFETENDIEITISPKNADSNWIAVDENGNMISEGKTPEETIELAKSKSENFSLVFVPKEGNTYIF